MKTKELSELKKTIEEVERIALIAHVSPDGDACGSALALRRALVMFGKRVVVLCDDPVPRIYSNLDGANEVAAPEDVQDGFDLVIAVDVGDRCRLGRCVRVFDAARHTAQIDHHGTNPAYAEVNCVQSPLSATGVLAMELIDALGIPLDKEMAECLFIAVATDTGNFKQDNADAKAFELAARCVSAGINTSEIARRVFDLRPPCQVKLIGRALSGMETLCDGAIAIIQVTGADFTETGALPEHTEGIIHFAKNTIGVRIACLLSEQEKQIKCSLRSLPPYDMARLAAAFGGGGHARAAGCVLKRPMAEAYNEMKDALCHALESGQ